MASKKKSKTKYSDVYVKHHRNQKDFEGYKICQWQNSWEEGQLAPIGLPAAVICSQDGQTAKELLA